MKEINGYFRVNPTPNGEYELAIYKKGFADLKDRLIIGLFRTESQAYQAIENVCVMVDRP